MARHHVRIERETITISRGEEVRERVEVYRVHCSCGYLGSPFIRAHVALHEANKHIEMSPEDHDAATIEAPETTESGEL